SAARSPRITSAGVGAGPGSGRRTSRPAVRSASSTQGSIPSAVRVAVPRTVIRTRPHRREHRMYASGSAGTILHAVEVPAVAAATVSGCSLRPSPGVTAHAARPNRPKHYRHNALAQQASAYHLTDAHSRNTASGHPQQHCRSGGENGAGKQTRTHAAKRLPAVAATVKRVQRRAENDQTDDKQYIADVFAQALLAPSFPGQSPKRIVLLRHGGAPLTGGSIVLVLPAYSLSAVVDIDRHVHSLQAKGVPRVDEVDRGDHIRAVTEQLGNEHFFELLR